MVLRFFIGDYMEFQNQAEISNGESGEQSVNSNEFLTSGELDKSTDSNSQSTQQETDWSKVDLSKIPQFQQWQSQKDKEVESFRQQAQAAEQQRAADAQRFQQMLSENQAAQSQLQNVAMQKMTGDERAQYAIQQLESERQRNQELEWQRQQENLRNQAVMHMQNAYGVDTSGIDSSNYENLSRGVMDRQFKELSELREEVEKLRGRTERFESGETAATTSDKGGTGGVSPKNQLQKEFEDAAREVMHKGADYSVMEKVQQRAFVAGVELDLDAVQRISMESPNNNG